MTKEQCPDCGLFLYQKDPRSSPNLYWCDNTICAAYKYNKCWHIDDLNAISKMRAKVAPHYTQQWLNEDKNEMKEVQITYKHNGTIVEILFITIKRRGWFEENVKPVLAVMKAMIPATMRSYDPVTYKWEIAVEYWTPLETTLKSMNFKVTVVENLKYNEPKVHVPEEYAENFYRAPAPTKEPPSSIREQLFALLEIPKIDTEPENLKSLYRNKARQLHPDLGGDAAKMSELNRLWSLYNAT